jgi:hypothetical protein
LFIKLLVMLIPPQKLNYLIRFLHHMKRELSLDQIFELGPAKRTTEQQKRLCDALQQEIGFNEKGEAYNPDKWYGCCYGWELPAFVGKKYQ